MHSPQTRLLIPLVVLLATLSAGTAEADKKAKNRISAVSFDDAGQQTTIEIRGSSTPTFTVYKLERPTRVVVDIAGATLNDKVKDAQENGATMAVGTWAVNQLAAYELDDGGKLVRVVVTLARPGRYDVKSDGNDVVVTVISRDAAPEAPDAAAVEAAQAAAEKAKKDSEEAKTARAKAEKDAAKAKGQADTSKKEADAAKQALAEAQDAAAKAEKKSKAERDRAEKALAEAKAEAERTKKAAAEAKTEAERTKKAVDDANARAEKTMKVAERAKAELETMKEELAAAKADAKRMKEEAAAAKADADAAKADASAQRKKAGDAERAAADAERAAADAEKAAAAAKKEKADSEKAAASAAKASADDKKAAADAKKLAADAKKAAADEKKAAADAKKAAAEAKQEAERLEAEAAEARAEAKRARAEAEAAQQTADEAKAQAAAAKKEAAAQKRDAEAAKAEAASQKKDAEAMRAEAERMLGEAKARLEDASAEAKAAKKSQEAAVAAQAKAEKKEEAARSAEAKAADERKAAQKALADAEKARAAGDADAEKRIADAEARLKKAEKARTTAEEQRRAAESTAEEARVLAERRKAETDDAVAAKAAAEKEKKAAAKAATEADQRAARAEALRKEEDTAAAAAAEAKAAGNRAEAKRLEKEAAQAKKAREQEETQLAAIVAERRAVEADLADARQAAEIARKDAAAAEKRAAAAKKDADEAEARAAAAKVELAKAEKARKELEAKKVEAAKVEAKKAEAKKVEAPPKVEPAPKAKAKAQAKPKAIAVEDVTFQQKGDDAKVIIEMSGEVEPEVKASGKRIEMTLAGVDLPKKLERTLDVSKFDGAVRSVSSYRDGGKVRVVVDLTSAMTPTVERSGTTVRMSFAGAGAVAKKSKKAKSKVKTESIPAPVVGGYGASSAPVTSKSVAQAGGSRRKVYRGPTIDLDFKDADIHNLLRFLANIGRVSIVVPDDIKATVTVRLKRVPWDQALEVILASKGLWYRKEGSLYRVAPRKVLDAEDQAEAERIRAAVQSEVPEAEVFTLSYASADEMQEKLIPLLSPKGKIEVDSRTNSLIISDIRSHRRRVIDLATRLDIQTPQIMIEARIVEARSTYARDIGIQWGGSANASQAGGNATGLIFPNSIAVTGGNEDRQTPVGGVATPSDFAVNLPAVTGTRSGAAFGISLGSVGGNFNLNLRLSAAEDTGTVRIVSSPKIMVLNNVEAEISQGQSIPISVVSAQGTQTQFVPAELSLKVTPYVSLGDCSIAMNVEVTKNEPDFVNTGARGDPTILTKEAKTRLLIADGETTVLGGITTRNSGVAYNKVPFFGDLPVVGWFFKRRVENDDRTELLIFITPRITNKAFLRCE